jgi:hypothetical protein
MAELVLALRRAHTAGVECLRRCRPYIGLQERPQCLSCPVEQRTVNVAPPIVSERGLERIESDMQPPQYHALHSLATTKPSFSQG